MNIKKIIKVCTIGITLASMLTACGGKAPQGVVATVNGVDIPTDKFDMEYAAQRNSIVLKYGEDYLKEDMGNGKGTVDQGIRQYVLNNLVQMETVKQDGEAKGIKVDPKKVEEQLNALYTQEGGQDKFNEALKKQGLTEEFFKNYLETKEFLSEYTKKMLEDLKPTDEEIKKEYEANKNEYFTANAAHILVADEKEAKEIKKQLDEGADFAKLAKEKSTDPGSKDKGGELGDFSNGVMDPDFEKAVKSLKAGEISSPVKTTYGYHIIKLNSFNNLEFDKVKDQISKKLTDEKFTKYLKDLEKKAKVKKYIDPKKDYELKEEYKVVVPKKENEEQTKKDGNKNNSSNENKTQNKNKNDNKKNNK